MTDEAVLISITIRVSEREIKFETETKIEDMEETIQGILLEAGQLTFGMVIKEIDDRIVETVSKGWQNVGTEERWLVSSIGTLRFKRRVYLDEKKVSKKAVRQVIENRTVWANERTGTGDGSITGVYGNVPIGSQPIELADQNTHQSQCYTTDVMGHRKPDRRRRRS